MSTLSPPQQQRSLATMNAISDATKQLLEAHTFEELTIDQIVKKAGSSTGSFYARFKGKDALLHYLHEEYATAARASIKLFVEVNGPEPLPVETFAERWVPPFIFSHFENHGLLRAVTTKSFDDPQFARRALDLVRWIATKLSEIVVNHSASREHHIVNIALSLQAIMAIMNQDLFYQTKGRPRIITDEKRQRLERIFIASMNTSSPLQPSS